MRKGGKAEETSLSTRRRERGRKTKLTDVISTRICDLVRVGHFKRVAAQQAGIDERTLYQWIEKGDPNHPATRTIYRQFRQALEAAEAESEIILLDKITKQGTPRDLLEVLARRFPERWARKIGLEAVGAGTTPDNPIHHRHGGAVATGVTVVIADGDDVWQPTDDPGFFEVQGETMVDDDGYGDRPMALT
jgi:hypothetical protein